MLTRENRGSFLAIYIAKVRITVHADGATIVREGHGSGEGRGTSPGEVHDTALKAAETDATKRALATFGRPFGLELYRKDKNAVSASSPILTSTTVESPPTQPRVGLHPDDTTPIPRPSHYYGRRHHGSMTDLLRQDQAKSQTTRLQLLCRTWSDELPRGGSTRASSRLPNPNDCATRHI